MIQRYSWQAAYNSAITENDPTRLALKIYEAQSACEERRLSPIDDEESKTLAEAEQVLRMLQNERLDSFFDPDAQ
jgi:hypothetical protein